jgi:aldehyde dehydrogenase (NAD(P)+)
MDYTRSLALDRDLETLQASKTAWAKLAPERKITLLRSLQHRVHDTASQWVQAAASAKGLEHDSPLAGEEWISGPWAVLYALARYIRTLNAIAHTGGPKVPRMRCARGRTIVEVFPHDGYDRVLLGGIRAEVWMQPGVTPEQTRETAGSFYRRQAPDGLVAVVLGAGNIASIAPLDVLYKLICDGAVCMLKLNPVNAYLGAIFESAFSPLVEAGFLRFAYGGADVGAYLCAHEAVDEIHVTGSERTHRAIVMESGGAKQITSELGNVTPTIVVPGPWNAADLQFQAENIATQKAHNAGFNCISAQVLIVPREWPHSRTLLERIADVFARMEARPEYYPGVRERRARLGCDSSQLRTLMAADYREAGHPAFTTEAFCGVLTYVEIPGQIEQYLHDAVAFANERLYGTLGANAIVHPQTLHRNSELMAHCVEVLRYGCVGVNAWTGVGYFLAEAPWGAFPGHTFEDPGSGVGVVHNAFLLERTEKSVVYAPFSPFPRSFLNGEFTLLPKPPWFVTNVNAARLGRALCDFELNRNPAGALDVAALALRG